MAEIGKTTLDGSVLYADDLAGARHEAGDLLRAGVEWSRVHALAQLVREEPDRSRRLSSERRHRRMGLGCRAWPGVAGHRLTSLRHYPTLTMQITRTISTVEVHTGGEPFASSPRACLLPGHSIVSAARGC